MGIKNMPLPKLKDIFKGGAEGVLKGAFDGFSNIVSKFKADPTKVLEYEKEIETLKINTALELEKVALQIEQEETKRMESENSAVSSRWASDMGSDSWLSKNSRPLVLLGSLLFLFIIIVIDSIKALEFEVEESYVDLLKVLVELTVLAYFGGRTIEKRSSIISSKKGI